MTQSYFFSSFYENYPYLYTLQVESLGGQCIPVQCDHSNDNNVKQLFERVEREQNGRLDVLVNNAYKAVKVLH